MVDFNRELEKFRAQKADREANPGPLIGVDSVKTYKGTRGHYIGRHCRGWEASALGNPFSVKEYGREEAIRLYNEWLRQEYRSKGPAYKELMSVYRSSLQIYGIVLLCWCKDKGPDTPCHGDVIKYAIETMWQKGILPPEN